jgi:hypothetical protein
MRLSNPDGGSGAASGWVGGWNGAGITRGAVAAAGGLATGGAGAVGGCPGVAAAGVSPGRRCGLIGLGLWRAGSGGGATGCTGARSRLTVPGGMASPTGAPHCSQKFNPQIPARADHRRRRNFECDRGNGRRARACSQWRVGRLRRRYRGRIASGDRWAEWSRTDPGRINSGVGDRHT